ncbi:C2 domain-containing protein At1g53590 [Dendrobium catenatum]|uniref:C2 domain-containing protein At1g53590 n=1 Tax=Dendrobium catenatum TaxID=906689 RepID=UPI0009F28A6E|nr:C2 domain-containing protein At1g53590 [Dendrobium catenatum]
MLASFSSTGGKRYEIWRSLDGEARAEVRLESWFSIHETPPIAYVKLEIIEATDMKPSDLNGLADPYVKVNLGTTKLQTNIQRKTLSPKWFEEFKIPISSWDRPNHCFLKLLTRITFSMTCLECVL